MQWRIFSARFWLLCKLSSSQRCCESAQFSPFSHSNKLFYIWSWAQPMHNEPHHERNISDGVGSTTVSQCRFVPILFSPKKPKIRQTLNWTHTNSVPPCSSRNPHALAAGPTRAGSCPSCWEEHPWNYCLTVCWSHAKLIVWHLKLQQTCCLAWFPPHPSAWIPSDPALSFCRSSAKTQLNSKLGSFLPVTVIPPQSFLNQCSISNSVCLKCFCPS